MLNHLLNHVTHFSTNVQSYKNLVSKPSTKHKIFGVSMWAYKTMMFPVAWPKKYGRWVGNLIYRIDNGPLCIFTSIKLFEEKICYVTAVIQFLESPA
jgi:hypothetical protein